MYKNFRIFFSWPLVGIYAFLIFTLSSLSQPFGQFGGIDRYQKYHLDWVLHGVEYALFGFLLIRAMALSFGRMAFSKLFWLAVVLGILYGASDEWHQSFVPLRDCSAVDWLADSIGVFLGSIFYARNKGV